MSDDNMTGRPRASGAQYPDDAGDAAGNAAVLAAYHGASREEPSAALDAAVLDMAHREVNGVHVATVRPRWFVPVSVAATLVVAVSLGLQVVRTPPETVTTNAEERTLVLAPEVDSVENATPADSALVPARQPVPEVRPAARAAMEMEQVAAPLSAYPEAAAGAPPPVPSESSDQLASRLSTPREAHAVEADAPAARNLELALSQASRAKRQQPDAFIDAAVAAGDWQADDGVIREAVVRATNKSREPAEWLEIIELLVSAGEDRKARIEWLAFRSVYPDEPLPPDFPEFE